MKRIVLATILIICTVFCLVACQKKGTEKSQLMDYLSFVEEKVYEGENSDFSVTVVEGKKEAPFVADGKANNVSEFTELKVSPLHVDLLNKDYTFEIIDTENNKATGALTKNVFSSGYKNDLKLPDNFKNIVSVKLISDKFESEITLSDKTDNCITYSQALKKAEQEFKEKIERSYDESGNFTCEICVKFISDKSQNGNPHFWYVAFMKSQSDYFAVLINPETGEVATKRE